MLFFMLIPAMFVAFALALGIIAIAEPTLKAVRWAAVGFLAAGVAMAADVFREIDNKTLGYFAILCHFVSIGCMLQAFAVRHGLRLPPLAWWVAGAASLWLFPSSPWWPGFSVRPVIVHAAGFLIIWLALRTLWPTRKQAIVDRTIYMVVFASAVTYMVRAILPIVDPLSLATIGESLLEERYVVLSHISSALLGLSVAILLMLAVGQDLLRRKGIESCTDQLTGLGNRRAMDMAIKAAARSKRPVGGVIAIDLDHFKHVNDRFGHAAGDMLLKAVGECLRNEFHDHGTVCRVGGEEFLLLVDRDHSDGLAEMSERARLAIRSIRLPEPLDDYQPTASVGFQEHEEAHDLEFTMRAADRAVYRAKSAGRDRAFAALPEDQHA